MRKNLLLSAAASFAALLLSGTSDPVSAQTRTTLDIYVVDVEGGNATLFVTPSGESLLIDTGNTGPRRRCAMPRASWRRPRMPASRRSITSSSPTGTATISAAWRNSPSASRSSISSTTGRTSSRRPAPMNSWPRSIRNSSPRPSTPSPSRATRFRSTDLDVQVVTSAGETIKTPLPGAGAPNPYCASFKPGDNNIEDPLSVGIHITFGKFRTMHLGDLTKNKEFELMCPNNRIGTLDVFLGLHHGVNTSSSEVMMHAAAPARRHHQQRHPQGRPARCDEGPSFVAGPREPVADPFLAAERAGIHRARHVHRQSAPTSRRPRCRSHRSPRPRPARTRRRRPPTTGRPTGSRYRRSRTERSP